MNPADLSTFVALAAELAWKPNDRDAFARHLDNATAVVRTWPQWKREALGPTDHADTFDRIW